MATTVKFDRDPREEEMLEKYRINPKDIRVKKEGKKKWKKRKHL